MVRISTIVSLLCTNFSLHCFSCCCDKIPLQKQNKGERVYSGFWFKDIVHHDEVKAQDLETAGHITSTEREVSHMCFFSCLYPFA